MCLTALLSNYPLCFLNEEIDCRNTKFPGEHKPQVPLKLGQKETPKEWSQIPQIIDQGAPPRKQNWGLIKEPPNYGRGLQKFRPEEFITANEAWMLVHFILFFS